MASTLEALLLAQANFLLNPPHCVAYAAATQSIPNATWTAILFNTNVVDSYSGHSTVTNTSRYVAQVSGWYDAKVIGALSTTSAAAALRLAVNGTPVVGTGVGLTPNTASGDAAALTSREVFLNAGDYVEGDIFQSTGGAVNTVATGVDFANSMTVRLVHL